jgi:hypothetical protein
MAYFQSTTRAGVSHAFHTALQTRGYEIEDFRLEEDRSSDFSKLLGMVGGVLRVRCRSTGEERIYSSGAGSAWLGIFVMDLAKGHFADAAKVREPRRRPFAPYQPMNA